MNDKHMGPWWEKPKAKVVVRVEIKRGAAYQNLKDLRERHLSMPDDEIVAMALDVLNTKEKESER